jgi:AraC-like DNA-binding protein
MQVSAMYRERTFEFDSSYSSSPEVSSLLLRAATCIDLDEAEAISLVRKASELLRPRPQVMPVPRRPGASSGLATWQIKRLELYINENIATSMTIEELAKVVNLSNSHLSAAFRISFGKPPHGYIIEKRIEQAKIRMAETDAPLCEIALDCGLADQAHLSRLFRRMTGTTPSAWRHRRR